MSESDPSSRVTIRAEAVRPLSAALRARVSAQAAKALVEAADLEPLLDARLKAARLAWPGIDVPDQEFIAYLADRLPGDRDPVRAIETIYAEDLYLACACAAGAPGALVRLDRTYLGRTADAVRRSIDAPDDLLSEVQQAVRQKLLVADGDRPAKILDYAGSGPLASWIRSAAIRTALNLLESRRPETPLDESWIAAVPDSGLDPELKLLKARCQHEFKSAFQVALGSLTEKQRDLLRMSLLEELSVDRIGEILGAPRSTVARWLADARQQLAEQTRRVLAERLKLDSRQLDSLLLVVRSQLDLSLHRYLEKE
jgi:RNA polymerase sigma-70 factor, ECF subfamily